MARGVFRRVPVPKKKPPTEAQIKKRARADTRQAAFLETYRKTCDITRAAAAIKLDKSIHYRWLKTDAKYAEQFDAIGPEVDGALIDCATDLALVGHKEALVYKGEFCYAKRRRVQCIMPDGTQAFEDELSKAAKAKVVARKTVWTKDGEQLVHLRRDAGLLAKLLAARMPEKFGTKHIAVDTKVTFTDPDDARAKLYRIVAGLEAARDSGQGAQPS